MTASKDHAGRAAAALEGFLRPGADLGAVAEIIQQVTDEAVTTSAERAAQLMSASPAVIYSFSARDDFAPTFVSDNLESLFGYAPAEYLGNPDFWREHVHPDDLQRVEAEVDNLFDTGRQTLEYRFRRKDGSYCWVNDEQHVVRDADGAPLEVVGSWSDISVRKAAEEGEDAARARLGVLLETAPSVIYSFKAKDDYAPTFISENIKRLLGYCPEKYLEHADFWRSHVHPDDLAAVEGQQSNLFEKGRHVTEYRFRKRNGTYIWVSDDQYLLRDEKGNPTEIVGSWSNITARKEAEQAESQARARFDLMLHSAPAVVYSFFGDRRLHAHLCQRKHQACARLRAGRLPDPSRLLAEPRASGRSRRGGGRPGEALRGRPSRFRVPFSQGGRRLLLGERRANPGQGSERQSHSK